MVKVKPKASSGRTDEHLPSRLLLYNTALYHKYHLPVLSMVISPFSVKIAVPPLVIPNSENDILIFHFETVPLFQMNGDSYIQNQQTCMYPRIASNAGVPCRYGRGGTQRTVQ